MKLLFPGVSLSLSPRSLCTCFSPLYLVNPVRLRCSLPWEASQMRSEPQQSLGTPVPALPPWVFTLSPPVDCESLEDRARTGLVTTLSPALPSSGPDPEQTLSICGMSSS